MRGSKKCWRRGSASLARTVFRKRKNIGPLQTNKAEEAVKLFDVIETLDREKLAKALVKAAEKVGRMPRLLVQVNTGEEPQKAGIAPQDVGDFLSLLKDTYNITPEGLMCIPPMGERYRNRRNPYTCGLGFIWRAGLFLNRDCHSGFQMGQQFYHHFGGERDTAQSFAVIPLRNVNKDGTAQFSLRRAIIMVHD